MFVTLKRTLTAIADDSQQLINAFKGILSGTITDVDGLSTAWDKSQCLFEVGSYPALSANWTVAHNIVSSTTPSCILTKPSIQVGKTNYLRLVGSAAERLYVETGTGIAASNALTYPVGSAGGSALLLDSDTAGFTYYLRFADSFVHIYTPNQYINSACAFDFSINPYDTYSEEASLKLLDLGYASAGFLPTLYIPKAYYPSTDSYASSLSKALYNITQARTEDIGISKAENLYDNTHLLIPLVFNDYAKGWLGGNTSEIHGIYFSTSDSFTTDQTVTIGSDVYHVFRNPTAGWLATTLNKK